MVCAELLDRFRPFDASATKLMSNEQQRARNPLANDRMIVNRQNPIGRLRS